MVRAQDPSPCLRRVKGIRLSALGGGVRLGVVISLSSLAAATMAVVPTALDSARASSELAATSEPLLVQERSTPTSTTYREPDGSYMMQAFTTAVNFQDASGEWQPVDNTFVDAPGTVYAVENAANDYIARIPADASSTPVKFSVDGAWVTMRMHGADDAPSVDGAEATYNDVEGTDSVTYAAMGDGLKESIRLDAAPLQSLHYVYTLATSPGLTPNLTEFESIDFVKANGETAFSMPIGNMTDSATPEPAFTEKVDYDLARTGEKWVLTVTPDSAWLDDPSRVYPVVIDPSLTNQPVSRDCWITQDAPDSHYCGNVQASGYIRVGRADASSRRRGLLDFDVSSIPPAANIDSATAYLYLDSSHSLSALAAEYALYPAGKPFDGTATWNSSGLESWTGGNPGALAYATKGLKGETSGYKDFTGLTEVVRGWITGNMPKNGLVLKQVGESINNVLWFYSSSTATANNGKRPYLTVNYSDDVEDSWVEPNMPATTIYGVDSYELEDLQTVAGQDSITLQKAVDLYGWQDEFADDIAELAATYPDLYSSAEMNPGGSTTPSAEVSFANQIPAGAAAILSDLPVGVSLNADAAYSETEMKEMIISANDAIVQAAGASAQVQTSFDETDTYIEASVYAPASGATTSSLGTAARGTIAETQPTINVPNVDVTMSNETVAEATTLRGGQRLSTPADSDGSVYLCTSGFPAKVQGSNTPGLLTAAHCKDDSIYYGALKKRRWALDDASRFLAASKGDMQFATVHAPSPPLTSEAVGSSFYSSPSNARSITGTAARVKGQKVCMFGRTSNVKRCSTVDKVDVAVNYGADGSYANLVRVKNDIVLGGDSGGPVFIGGKAIGVISGHGVYWTGSDTPIAHHFSLYSPIGPIKAVASNGGMDLVVKTAS